MGLYETPAWDLSYNPHSSYSGLFGNGGSQGIYWITYCDIRDGKLNVKTIAQYSFIDYRDPDKGFKYTIEDNTLYQVYQEYKDQYKVSGYTLEKIKSMGWNSFIAKYGY